MNKLYYILVVFIPTLAIASSWDSLSLSKHETNVELKGNLVVVEQYISGTQAYLCKPDEKIKKGMVNCIDLVSENMSLLEIESKGCVIVSGSFRIYSSEFIFMGSAAEVGLLKLDSTKNIRKC